MGILDEFFEEMEQREVEDLHQLAIDNLHKLGVNYGKFKLSVASFTKEDELPKNEESWIAYYFAYADYVFSGEQEDIGYWINFIKNKEQDETSN